MGWLGMRHDNRLVDELTGTNYSSCVANSVKMKVLHFIK